MKGLFSWLSWRSDSFDPEKMKDSEQYGTDRVSRLLSSIHYSKFQIISTDRRAKLGVSSFIATSRSPSMETQELHRGRLIDHLIDFIHVVVPYAIVTHRNVAEAWRQPV